MRIYRCKELLKLPMYDRQGRHQEGDYVPIRPGDVFTAEDDQGNAVWLEGLRGMRLSLSGPTIEKYFEELTR